MTEELPGSTGSLTINKGKTIYLVKWNMEDAKSREEMDYIPALQARLPEDIVFPIHSFSK
jgi:hypothetical protein